jgi:transcriptional regulator with XRE-family HTH domain
MALVTPPSFGERLKSRRQRLGVSQLQLAVDAGVSPRHLSFIETGRSRPSREMVLRLAERLRLPLRDQNTLLLAAGFAPAFAQADLEAPELGAVRRAAALVLANHEPFPAIAIDRRRNVVMSNAGAKALLGELPREVREPAINIYRLLLHPQGLARRIVNFAEYAPHLVARLQRDADTYGDEDLLALLAEVQGYPALRAIARAEPTEGAALTLRLRDDDGGELAFLTMIATFGTPFDVTVAELVVESLFPADARTAAHFRRTEITRRR